MNLQEKLEYLTKFGNPRLSKCENGWHSSIEIFVTGKGINFKIQTGFDHKSSLIAVDELLSRVKEALNSVGKYEQIES